VRALIKGETPRCDEKHRVVRKDGTVLHVHSTGATTRDPQTGRALRLVATVRDITSEVQAEAGRVQTQKLEGLGLLAGGIAHDFNNLLTVLSSSLALADRRAQRGEDVTEALTTASLAVTRATVLTRQLLAYAGRGRAAQRPIDLNELVESMGQLLAVSIPRKVKLERHLAERLPGVHGDDGQLQQVVMNLITNAAEAIGEREGTVTLTTAAVTLTEPPPGIVGPPPLGPVVRISVRDDGVGMSPEVQARIFDPFFSTKGSGRGLGLAALAGILRSHGGAIALESAPGRGTTFSVFLPALAEPAPSSRSFGARGPSEPITCRVLLVDDEELLRRSASRLLKSLGCQVTEAETGKVAVEKVRAAPAEFDVVLMDLTMPEMDGAEAGRHIAELAPKLPIILSSGYSTTNAERPDGRLFSLAKPYSVTALESVLREALRRPGA
jgi:signal transduction histidine kinase/CheY-like chemotaxis protein